VPSFDDADERLQAAENEFRTGSVAVALSLAQESIEISLKALMQSYEIEYEKDHGGRASDLSASPGRRILPSLTSQSTVTALLIAIEKSSGRDAIAKEAKVKVARAALLCDIMARFRNPTQYGFPETTEGFSAKTICQGESMRNLAKALLDLCHELNGSCHGLAKSRMTSPP
jgi:hypothetical protein